MTLLSCWLLAPSQTISVLAPLCLPLQNEEVETHQPDWGEGPELGNEDDPETSPGR